MTTETAPERWRRHLRRAAGAQITFKGIACGSDEKYLRRGVNLWGGHGAVVNRRPRIDWRASLVDNWRANVRVHLLLAPETGGPKPLVEMLCVTGVYA